MPNMTVLIPADLKTRMDEHDEVNWSALARHAFAEYLQDIENLRKLKGSVKPFTPAQQKAARKKLATMSSLDLFRAFGFDKMSEIRYISRDDERRARSTSKRDMQGIREVRGQ